MKNNKGVGVSNQSVGRFTYLLSDPFPVEKITLGTTKKQVLEFLYKGGNPHSISNYLKISRPTTIQHLEELRKKGLTMKGIENKDNYGDPWLITKKGKFLIEKCVGFPVKSTRVTPNQSVKYLPPDFNRGHALQFKLKLPKGIRNWTSKERKELLESIGIPYKNLNLFGGGQGIEFRDKKIHLTNSSIIIYDSESHFAITAEKSEDNASIKTLYLIRALERELRNNFSINGKYAIRITKRHHALIKNAMAEIYNKPKRVKLEVYDENGLWLLVDNSWNLGELECVHSRTGVPDADGMREVMNSFKRTGFKVTSEFVIEHLDEIGEMMKKSSETQMALSQVIKQMESNVIHLTKNMIKGGGSNADK